MTGLRTARAVVVDDERDEAMPVIEALSRLGIGSVYIRGDRLEDLPASPFPGVRVVFLDMLLGTVGNERQIGAHTANVFAHSQAQLGTGTAGFVDEASELCRGVQGCAFRGRTVVQGRIANCEHGEAQRRGSDRYCKDFGNDSAACPETLPHGAILGI